MRKALLGGCLALTLAAFFASTRQYLGFEAYNRYLRLRAEAKNIQREFPVLQAALRHANRYFKHPSFSKELGKLYLERARVESQNGDPALRDVFLDKAIEEVAGEIRSNPLDSAAYFEMGKLWMFYNEPLLIYAHKGRAFLRLALKLNPTNEILNLDVLFFFLAQWDLLDESEKNIVWARLERGSRENKDFVGRLRSLWVQTVKTDDALRAILMSNAPLWPKIREDFK